MAQTVQSGGLGCSLQLSHYIAPDKLPNLQTLQFPSSVKCNNTVQVTDYPKDQKTTHKVFKTVLDNWHAAVTKTTKTAIQESQ